MLKWIVTIFLLFFLGIYGIAYLYGVSLRHAGIIEGRMHLKMAVKDFAEHGYVTNYGASVVSLK